MKNAMSLLGAGLVWLLLNVTQLHAGNGDLIVNGSLGVGTTSPAAKLDVCDTSPGSGPANSGSPAIGGLRVHSGGAVSLDFGAQGSSNPIYTWMQSRNIADYSQNYNLVLNQNGGNVGIGTSSPGDNLEVLGNVFASAFNSVGTLTRYYSTGGIAIAGITGNPYAYISAYSNSGGAGKNLSLQKDGGNVGIGTVYPGHTLDVNGTMWSLFAPTQGSDIKLKNNLLLVKDALTKVLQLDGVSYEWNTDIYNKQNYPEITQIDTVEGRIKSLADKNDKIPKGRHYGVIAQDIEKVLPEVVSTGADGTKAVAYTEIIPILIEAIKSQQTMIAQQQKQLNELRQLIK